MPIPAAAPLVPLLLVAVLASGCMGGGDGKGDGGDGDGQGTLGSDSTRSPIPFTQDPQDRFAILIVDGHLEGEGPEPSPAVACSLAPPNGVLDFEANRTWARPGQHSFKAGQTWLLVLDRVTIDDPRGGANGCRVDAALQPFDGEAQWAPRMDSQPFHLALTVEGDDLVVGKNQVAPENALHSDLEFADGDYTFTGDLAFTHAGWWPTSAFEERDGAVEAGDAGAVWWD